MNYRVKTLLVICSIFVFAGCDDGFEELNQNPFSPTEVAMGPLFNFIIQNTAMGGEEQLFMHNEILYPATQLGALTAETFQNTPRGTDNLWQRYYRSLANARELEKRFDNYQGDQEATYNVRAMLKTLIAYETFRMTDLFGDIPFFDAGRGYEDLDFLRPKYDSQEDIYLFLLEELKWVEDHINTDQALTASGEPYLSFAEFDNLFNANGQNGDQNMMLWRKFANALRLRYAVRMSERAGEISRPIIQEIIEGDLPLIEEGEDVLLSPRQLNWEKESTHWSFREHKRLRLGSTLWNMMSENDETDGSGIFDPRMFVFFEPNNNGEWAPFPQIPTDTTPPSGGIPYQEHRDFNFGIKGQENIYSPFNYYLIRDQFDVPEILMTAAEVSFLKAEIFERGLGVPMDENEVFVFYIEGITRSIKFWLNIPQNTEAWSNRPSVRTSGEIFQTINHPKVNIFDTSDRLRLIYAQRWIDAFRQPWEAFALSRRTNATPREGDESAYYRFRYPASELQQNTANWNQQVSTMGADVENIKVWWMN